MNYSTATGAKWIDSLHSSIVLSVIFDGIGQVPFTASPRDSEHHGRDIFARAIAGDFGPIAEYVAPSVPASPVVVTPWQIREAMNALGLRSAVEAAVAASNQSTKDGWEFAQNFNRDHPLIASVAAALGKTGAEIDALFALAVTL